MLVVAVAVLDLLALALKVGESVFGGLDEAERGIKDVGELGGQLTRATELGHHDTGVQELDMLLDVVDSVVELSLLEYLHLVQISQLVINNLRIER